MRVGDILQRKPTLDASTGFSRPGVMPCRVVYIHPRGRFYVVEFTSSVTGQTWRETFYPEAKPDTVKRDRHSPRLANHYSRRKNA